MKKLLIGFLVFALILLIFPAVVSADINAVTPSTNDINRTKDWAHVDELSKDIGEVTLQFISTRSFYSCFEYRTDGDTSQVIGVNYNTDITDGLYPFVSTSNTTVEKTIHANEYVEIRMVFGAETDERFDWTRFDVIPAPEAPEPPLPTTPTGVIGVLGIQEEKEEEEVEVITVRTHPMTCYQVWINEDNNFEFVFWWEYADNNWVKIYDMSGKMVYEIDMPYDNPNIIVDLPDGMYTVKTFNDQPEPLQTFVIGKP